MQVWNACRSFGFVAVWASLSMACGSMQDEGVETLVDASVVSEAEAGVTQAEVEERLFADEFEDPRGVGRRAQRPTKKLLRTPEEYVRFFGHPAPSTVDFRAGEVVLFYAAGQRPTGGYDAQLQTLVTSNGGNTLHVVARLVAPGEDCVVTEALTYPYVLAKVTAPRVRSVRWTESEVRESCSNDEMSECAAVLCAVGSYCRVREGEPVCETIPEEEKVRCGGVAGLLCPEGMECVDDATDSCDPAAGGRDCFGICIGGTPPAPEPANCGNTTCGEGTVCCNASCGICTPPGFSCVQIACE